MVCQDGALLRLKKILGVVTGEEKEIDDTEDSAKDGKRAQALTTILISIEDAYVAPVITERDPAVVSRRLKGLYAPSSGAHIEALQSELHEIAVDKGESVRDFGNRITAVRNHLAADGEPAADQEQLRAFLRGISPQLKIQALITRQSAVTFNEAIRQLAAEEVRQKGSEKEEATVRQRLDDLAITALVKGNCAHCGRVGHDKNKCFHHPHCPVYKPYLAKKRIEEQGSAGYVHHATAL